MPPCIGFSGSLFVRACQPHTHAPYKQTSIVLLCGDLGSCCSFYRYMEERERERERKREGDVRLCAYDNI